MNWKTSTRRSRKAVLLDRDGTLIPDLNYLSRPEQVVLLPGTVQALDRLRAAGFLLIGVTNQSAVARGMIKVEDLDQIHLRLQTLLGSSRLDAIYYCPHHPGVGGPPWQADCACRKPKPGMLLRAAREWELDLSSCWMVGDRAGDLEAGQRAGCHSLLMGKTEAADSPGEEAAPDLETVVNWILSGQEKRL